MKAVTSDVEGGEWGNDPESFDLDVTLLEVSDPASLVNMTDDGCGTTCEKSTCITAV